MKKIILTLLLTLSALVNVNAVAAFSLDVDGNGVLSSSNDGLIIFKYLLNPNSNNLHTTIAGDVIESRKTTAQLKAYLDDAMTILDIDGNGALSSSNDGLVIFKYLLNPNSNNLHTTISNSAIEGRKTTAELRSYLDVYINAATATATAPALNDTGVTVSGTNGGTAAACSTDSNTPVQDCHQGRDADTNLQKTGAGQAGFDFTKLGSDGAQLTIQNGTYSATGTAANGTKWSCVRDNVTGMIWEVKTADNKDSLYTWGNRTSLVTAANAENSGSGLCGTTNWRVPSVNELFSIMNYNNYGPSIDSDYFPNTFSGGFWSEQEVVSDTANVWRVNFNNGSNSGSSAKYNSYRVRLVSAATAAVSYTNNNNGTITDNTTGLMWKACDQRQAWDNNNTAANLTDDNCTYDSNATDTYIWTAALTEAQNHTFAGYDDWRLPNIKELTSIADYTAINPSINPVFPNANTAIFWSSTLYADITNSNAAWNVNFGTGFIFANGRFAANRVRLVRTAD